MPNPSDPLALLHPYPEYYVFNPVLGRQELVLGLTPAASRPGRPADLRRAFIANRCGRLRQWRLAPDPSHGVGCHPKSPPA